RLGGKTPAGVTTGFASHDAVADGRVEPSADTRAPWQRCGSAWHRFGSALRQLEVVIDVRVKGVGMAQENIMVVRFTEPSKAYQALSVLKECDAKGLIGLES